MHALCFSCVDLCFDGILQQTDPQHGAASLPLGMADGMAGSGRRKRARRGGEASLDDPEATNAVRPRMESPVPASGAFACPRLLETLCSCSR